MRFGLNKNDEDYIPPNCTEIKLFDASKLNFLCTFLHGNLTIKTVDLYGNQIGAEGAKAIAEILKANRTITKFYLSRNQIGVKGANSIAEVLKVNRTITELILRWNRIGNKGAKAIAEALKVNFTITQLDLAGNEIGVKGAKAIAEALKVNYTITILDLNWNQISKKGAKAIAEALKVNCTVIYLNLWAFIIDHAVDVARIEIEKILKVNHFIHDELKQVVADTQCKTMALGLSLQVPIYLLLDIYELLLISNLERKTNSYEFYNNTCFLKLLEKKVSKKRFVYMMDKVIRNLEDKGKNTNLGQARRPRGTKAKHNQKK